jgi:hypothetical protein|tara:strand:- start:11 stop:136 length:126 start_codon:yes stop_codon:yes gene_type:complete
MFKNNVFLHIERKRDYLLALLWAFSGAVRPLFHFCKKAGVE